MERAEDWGLLENNPENIEKKARSISSRTEFNKNISYFEWVSVDFFGGFYSAPILQKFIF